MMRRRAVGGGTLIHEMPTGSKVVRYTLEETAKHTEYVESAFAQGWTAPEIIRAGKKQLGVTVSRMVSVIAKVREKFAREDALARPSWKSEQIRRLMRQLRVAMGEKDDEGNWILKPNMSAYTKIESILADVQGTREPIEINVDVSYTEAMMTVIGQLTPQQMDGLLERARERKRLAEAFTSLQLPEAKG